MAAAYVIRFPPQKKLEKRVQNVVPRGNAFYEKIVAP